jgi:hypothetical protein
LVSQLDLWLWTDYEGLILMPKYAFLEFKSNSTENNRINVTTFEITVHKSSWHG